MVPDLQEERHVLAIPSEIWADRAKGAAGASMSPLEGHGPLCEPAINLKACDHGSCFGIVTERLLWIMDKLYLPRFGL